MDKRILKVESITGNNNYFLKSDINYSYKLKKKKKYTDEDMKYINENETESFEAIMKRRKK